MSALWCCYHVLSLSLSPSAVHKGSRMKSFAASGDLSTAVVCLFDSTVTVWDLAAGEPRAALQRWGERDETKGHTSAVNEVLMSGDGTVVVTLAKDATCRVWDARTGACRHVLRGHEDSVGGGCLSDEGRLLATHSYDGTARLWSLDGGPCLATIPLSSGVSRMALSRCGWRMGAALADGTVFLYDMRCPERGVQVRGHAEEVTDLSFSADGASMATCSLDCTARLVDVATGALRGVFVSDCSLTCCHYDSATQGIVAGTDRGVVHFIDAAPPA